MAATADAAVEKQQLYLLQVPRQPIWLSVGYDIQLLIVLIQG
jgi:hypothetical protein